MSRDKKATYYDAGGIETIDVVEAKTGGMADGFIAYCLGNIIKYACRAPFKGTFTRDIEKILVYSQMILAAEKDKELVKEET